MTDYPEHDKVHKIVGLSQPLGEFLDWARGEGWHFCEWVDTGVNHQRRIEDEEGGVTYDLVHETELLPIRLTVQEMLGRFFDIDLDKLYSEKEDMLDAQRRHSPGATP